MDKNKKQNLKIVFALLIIFLIGLSTLLILSNFETKGASFITNDKNIFFSKIFSKNSIFILGSSQIAPLNATSINQFLNNESEVPFEVYNLAYAGNAPFREQFDDELIKINPKLIIYGISYRDFEFSKNNDFDNSIFPNLKNIVEYELLKIGDDNIPLNPQFLIRSLARDLSFDDSNVSDIHTVNNTPFFVYDESPVLKTYDEIILNLYNVSISKATGESNRLVDISHPFKKHSEKFLELFIEKMKINSIDLILISTPLPDINHLDIKLKNDYEQFLKKLEIKYKIKIFRFDTTYYGLDIWQDSSHISYHPDVHQFNNDVSKIILNKIQ